MPLWRVLAAAVLVVAAVAVVGSAYAPWVYLDIPPQQTLADDGARSALAGYQEQLSAVQLLAGPPAEPADGGGPTAVRSCPPPASVAGLPLGTVVAAGAALLAAAGALAGSPAAALTAAAAAGYATTVLRRTVGQLTLPACGGDWVRVEPALIRSAGIAAVVAVLAVAVAVGTLRAAQVRREQEGPSGPAAFAGQMLERVAGRPGDKSG